ncbi:NADPH oxidase organizer 1 isoform X1 [Neoarius graeffei]|uniref:NADPH oxidase organizer 1 isoform X1 n=1 Tax=Neoarius graeffei TaxID=443677 RepID=UPI00298C8CCB|nr:NADPH oxidase organizer 1 isoform X1 [Neoarius graeffei]XP_060757707.1 NADPH oxidase organizer 1 isoform X1 [Neoarius graeffei]XP_060757708.1 NADPH oxidase organizer 1 isoform X1 [Neoarius graeffei]
MEERRLPVRVLLLGVMHKEKSKLYMASVLWSDQNEIIIYRTLEEFRTLHITLKKKCAALNVGPFQKSVRTVPKFKAEKVKKGLQKNSYSKSLLRLKLLEEYCTALLSAVPSVSQSSELVQFLLPSPDDLKPEFSQNSIVVMPSEDTLGRSSNPKSDAGVTKPFVTQMYRCIAAYETKDTKNRPFKVEVGETVDVLIKDKAGWWLVENEAKCLAWFPAPYLENAEADDEGADQELGENALCVATKSYKSTKIDELSVEIGSVVEVLRKSNDGWWLVRYNCRTGYIPSMYLQPYINPRVQMIGAQRGLQTSSLHLARLQVSANSSPMIPGHELSRSQCNLLQIPGGNLSLRDKSKSHSLNVLTDVHHEPPTAEVEPAEDSRARSLSGGSSIETFSYSGSSSSSGSVDVSSPEDVQRCRTTQPDCLNPTNNKLLPATSELNMFNLPRSPKVPPRPQAQEILKRCTTMTRKNVSRSQMFSPTVDIHSR